MPIRSAGSSPSAASPEATGCKTSSGAGGGRLPGDSGDELGHGESAVGDGGSLEGQGLQGSGPGLGSAHAEPSVAACAQ